MDFRRCLAIFVALAGSSCVITEPFRPTPQHRVFDLEGRVSMVAVEATRGARRSDPGTRVAAVGLLAALARDVDTFGVVPYGEDAAALVPPTSMAVRRVRPPLIEDDLRNVEALRGPARTPAALAKVEEHLEVFTDQDDTTVVWLGAASPEDDLQAMQTTLERFAGRGWRILVVPFAEVLDEGAVDELSSGTRGARYATDGGKQLLRGVLAMAADMHGLFRRVEPANGPARAPEKARRLLFVGLTPPGSDLARARTADKTGNPVRNPWIRRPAEREPPYRVLELTDAASLQSRAWVPQTIGTPEVFTYAEMPMRMRLRPNAPTTSVTGGGLMPVSLIVDLGGDAKAVLADRLTATARFDGEAPVQLASQTAGPGQFEFSANVPVPTKGLRPTCSIELRLENPEDDSVWVWSRRLQVRASQEGPPPLEIDPPETDLGPRWSDQPGPPVPIVLRARAPLTVEPEFAAPLAVTPARLEVPGDGTASFEVTLAPGTLPGEVKGQVSLRVRDASGSDLAARFVPVRATVVAWNNPSPVSLGTRKPGESATATILKPWSPVPTAPMLSGRVVGPGDRAIDLTTMAEADGSVSVAITVPGDAPAGTYQGEISIGADRLEPRTVPVALIVGDGATAPLPAPVITSVLPVSGPLGGGGTLTIEGTGFLDGVAVTVGGRPAPVLSVVATTITATIPAAEEPGSVDVRVSNPDGQSAVSAGGYRYEASGTTPPVLEPLVAVPAGLSLSGDAGTRVEGEVTIAHATADRLPTQPTLSDLRTADGNDVIAARFDCSAEVTPADGETPARIRYRVTLPRDVAPGKYIGTLVLTDKATGETVEVAVEVAVP